MEIPRCCIDEKLIEQIPHYIGKFTSNEDVEFWNGLLNEDVVLKEDFDERNNEEDTNFIHNGNQTSNNFIEQINQPPIFSRRGRKITRTNVQERFLEE